MKKFLILVITLALILNVFSGCTIVQNAIVKGINGFNDSDEVQTVTSEYSKLSVDFPKSWVEMSLNDVASIQMALAVKEQYMIVIEENSIDFEESFTVDDYSEVVLENMKVAVKTSENPVVSTTTIGSGLDARQFELTGSVDKINVKYLVTCVENNGVFYNFTAWSLLSKYDAAKTVFETILKSAAF
jgi:hypothetical protein